MSHSFQVTTFTAPTYCDFCNGFLWGLSKQGLKCSACQTVVHSKCRQAVSNCKKHQTPFFTNSTTQMLQQLQLQQKSCFRYPLSRQYHRQKAVNGTDSKSLWNEIKQFTTSEEMQDIVISSAMHSLDTTQSNSEYLAHLPPLSAQNTTRNFTRFVSRCGPMFNFRDQVILLLNWEKPVNTMIAMLIYCLICLHPKLVFLVPHIFLLQIIVQEYNRKYYAKKVSGVSTEDDRNNAILHPASPSSSTASYHQQQMKQHNLTAEQQHQTTHTAKSNRFTGGLASLFPTMTTSVLQGDGNENSPEYLRNLQNLQNMMGEMSDLHDFIVSRSHYVNWSDEVQTMYVFQLTMISLIIISVIIWFVPLQSIFLVGGIGVFLLNTRFAKHAVKRLVATSFWQRKRSNISIDDRRWESLPISRLLDREREKEEKAQEVLELSLFENQVWRPQTCSFAPCMLPGDSQGPWTEFSGTKNMSPKEKLNTAPVGYQWIEEDWTLDAKGPWIDEQLNIELMVHPDDDGWVYMNSNLDNVVVRVTSNIEQTKDIDSYYIIRRRRWVRQCKKYSRNVK